MLKASRLTFRCCQNRGLAYIKSMMSSFGKVILRARFNRQIFFALALLWVASAEGNQSLMEAYDRASSYGRYSKYLELDTAFAYDGDLVIPSGQNVFIDGGGALIFGIETDASIRVGENSNLDILNCVIVGGQGGILFDSLVSGTISNNTIVGCREAGISAQLGYRNNLTFIWSNIITACLFGIYCVDSIPAYVAYNDIFDIDSLRYALYCPG
jgi:hypothetical protein